MSQGRLVAFTPQAISGYSTPVITEHLKPGSITYNANGALNQIGGRRKRSSRKYKKRSSRKYKQSRHKQSRHKRSSKKRSNKKRTRKY